MNWRAKLIIQKSRSRPGERSKTLNKFMREDVQVIRVPVVEKVPNDLDVISPRGTYLRHRRIKVVSVRLTFDQMPPQAVPGREYADLGQSAIVLVREFVMARGGDHIQAFA